MFKNEYVLSVDIKKSMSTIIPVFVQFDSAALVFKIYDDGKSFDLTDFTSAEVSHKLPDGTLVIGYGALETLSNGNKAVRYTYQGNEMSQPGFVSTSLSVYSTNKKVSILPFKVEIVGDTYEESIEASPEVSILQQLISSVSGVSGQATQAVSSATQAVTQANNAVTSATQATTSATNAATNANDKATLANTAATNANTKANLADEKATLANQAATNANLAITNVNAARDATVIATNNAQAIADNTRSVGTFNLSTAYLKNNIVTSNGSSWIALVNTQNNPLPVLPTIQNTWWRLLAQKGSDGAGTVTKVNSVSPDGTGAIILTPSDIGAASSTHAHTTAQVTGLDTALAAKYVKPTNGIPSSDLASAIQASLTKADTALQSVADASTSVKGIVQLNNTLTSTSTSQAVTAAQAKVLNDNLTSHTGNSDIHVTATNKTDWNAKETTTGSQQKVNTHAAIVATTSQLGHVKPDGTTIIIDNNGVISSVGGGGSGGTPDAHTHPTSQIVGLDTALGLKANLASPTFTGTPVAPTAPINTNTTQIATTAFVRSSILDAVDSPDFTGTPTAPTATSGTNTTQIATTAFVATAITNKTSITGNAGTATKLETARTINGVSFDGSANITIADNTKAPLASPTFTGMPSAPTATSGTNTTQLATTAFVTTAITNKTSVTGNAGTATKLETARTINGVSFDGSANITIVDSTKAPLASPALTGTPTAPTAANTTNTTQIATTAFVQSNVNAHLNDYMPHESSLSQTASSMDSNGIYTIVEFKRADNTLYMRSTATNPNVNGHYQTITWRFYAANGTTLSLTKIWTITYNSNGLAISKAVD